MPSATLLLFGIAAFTVDQASKAAVLAVDRHLTLASYPRSFLRCGRSTGIGRGVLGSSRVLITLWVAEVGWLMTMVETVPTFGGGVAPAALGVALGGAAGNLVDRVRRGGVVDFVDLRFWPVFNLADVAIVAGVLLFAFSVV